MQTPTKDASFYEYMDSKELFSAIKNNQIKLSEVKNKENDVNKVNNIKIDKKTTEQKEVINNLENFTILDKRLLIFLETLLKRYLMHILMQNKMKLKKQELKY